MIRSRRSLQKSDREQFALFHERIDLSLTKNDRIAGKTDEQIPNPAVICFFQEFVYVELKFETASTA